MRVPRRLTVPKGAVTLFPSGSPVLFLIDEKVASKVRKVNWCFQPKNKRARGFFGRNETRQYLHRYILTLNRKYYPEVTFANGDWWDCRISNLRPYSREDDGACRKPFKGRKRKGVSWHRRKRRWIAMIRTKGKLKHLGYFATADLAAEAYARAWNAAHPDKVPVPVKIQR